MIDKSAEELAFTAGGDAAKLLIDSYLGSASNEEELTFGIYILKSTALGLSIYH